MNTKAQIQQRIYELNEQIRSIQFKIDTGVINRIKTILLKRKEIAAIQIIINGYQKQLDNGND